MTYGFPDGRRRFCDARDENRYRHEVCLVVRDFPRHAIYLDR